jgi:pimeloyl-ACP methyl ester carboxylesterase
VSPALDRAFLSEQTSILDRGTEERLFTLEIGSDRCFALLDRPAGGAEVRNPGFVSCHSYGDDLLNLRRIDRGLARTLARLGHPVLSFNRRGFGDSTGSLAEATAARQVEDVEAAVRWLAEETGLTRFGLIGARFGALIAGLAARRGGVDELLLVNPTLRGTQHFRHMMRQTQVMGIVGVNVAANASRRGFRDELREAGVIDLAGYPLYGELYEELEEVDLSADVGRFRGRALVMQATRSSTLPADVMRFKDRVETAGGTCRLELVPEPERFSFGEKSYQSNEDDTQRTDVQGPLIERLNALVSEWVSA